MTDAELSAILRAREGPSFDERRERAAASGLLTGLAYLSARRRSERQSGLMRS